MSDSILAAAVPPPPGCPGPLDKDPDGYPGHAVGGYADLTIRRCTVFDRIEVSAIDLAEDCIFAGSLRATNTARGCVRYSSLTADTLAEDPPTPPRYACQPDLALAARLTARPRRPDRSPTQDPQAWDQYRADAARWEADARAAAAVVAPRFRSTHFGDAEFGQLADGGPAEVRRGGTDGSETGAFHDQYTPQREALLAARLAEYTPAGGLS